jgi:outer membrane protein assembly factor BamB
MLSATLFAQQSAPASPPATAAASGYAEAWAVPIEGVVSLVIAVGQHAVFVAHEDGITAYAKSDGKSLWSRPHAGVTQLLASARPDALLAAAGTQGVVAFDPATGEVRWTATLTGPADKTYLATFHDDGLTVASGSAIRAHRRDGTVAWSVSVTGACTTPAVERDGVAWAGTDAPSLVRIDPASGAVLGQTSVASPPQAIVSASAEAYVVAVEPVLARYRPGETKPSWQWKPNRGVAGVVGAPVVGKDYVFVTALDNTVQAFDRGGGAVRWRQPLPSRPAPGITESGGFLVVPLITGEIVRLSPVNGAKAPFAEMKLETNARLQAFQTDADGGVYTVTFAARTPALTAWRPAAPTKSPLRPSQPRPAS